MMGGYYADDEVFRTGTGAETLEVSKFGREVLVSIDSFDAPEQAIRVAPEAALALSAWLTKSVEASR